MESLNETKFAKNLNLKNLNALSIFLIFCEIRNTVSSHQSAMFLIKLLTWCHSDIRLGLECLFDDTFIYFKNINNKIDIFLSIDFSNNKRTINCLYWRFLKAKKKKKIEATQNTKRENFSNKIRLFTYSHSQIIIYFAGFQHKLNLNQDWKL